MFVGVDPIVSDCTVVPAVGVTLPLCLTINSFAPPGGPIYSTIVILTLVVIVAPVPLEKTMELVPEKYTVHDKPLASIFEPEPLGPAPFLLLLLTNIKALFISATAAKFVGAVKVVPDPGTSTCKCCTLKSAVWENEMFEIKNVKNTSAEHFM
jgi:hypothetical protein